MRRRLWTVLAVLALALSGGFQPTYPQEHMRFPRLIDREMPRFPEAAVRAGIHDASVFVQIRITADGTTIPVEALKCSHPMLGFEEKALQALSSWRWDPALSDGRPVAVYLIVPVRFHHESSPHAI